MIKELLFGSSSVKGPVWIKSFTEHNKQVDDLLVLSSMIKSDRKKLIDRDIIYLKQGIDGEKRVSYEIENSFIPMLVLYDIRIEDENSIAQIDYVLITKYFILVLETKKLNGDILVNESGEFIRYFKNSFGKVYKKEGMYSPVAQNERHVRILENYLKKHNKIKNIPIYSCVVLANPKSVVNRNKAPENIKNQIIKYDNLTSFIESKIKDHEKMKDGKILDKQMYSIANFLKEGNKEATFDFHKKYGLSKNDFCHNASLDRSIKPYDKTYNSNYNLGKDSEILKKKRVFKESKIGDILDNFEKDKLNRELKNIRLKLAKKENLPAYYIFNDETLNDILLKMPKCKEELLKVKGFGKVKVEKYGEYIIDIFN